MPEWYGGSYLNSEFALSREDQWREQWERTERWFKRVQLIQEKSVTCQLTAEDIDTIFAYFQNAFHLRDWIEDSRPPLRNKLETFVRSNFEIGACRDICNGLKHKRLTRPSHDADFNFYREYDYDTAETKPDRNPTQYRFAFADGERVRKFDAFELASRCRGLWMIFIQSNILSSS